jgi:hypothetical protein
MQKRYSQITLFFLLVAVSALSAGGSSSTQNDPYTGLYYVHGSKIMTFYNCAFIGICGPDDGPFMDTTRIASVVAVKWMEEKTDTLHFFGLPGADEGEIKYYFGFQRSERAGEIKVYDEQKIYGTQSGDDFEIRFNNAGFFYEATGTISNDVIDIEGTFNFRTTTVEYDLTGEKINTLN